MATLVLSTVGTALGGPVGSAIGALIGQSIDQALLAPVRRGPRVGDLTVQTSSYGTQIPRIYGAMRVAGTVVWSTDLVESELTDGAKGQPDVTYSYSVSLAVALSSRTARSIGRIWADGKLLRGAAGDFKVETQFRFYDGNEDQIIDPLIGSVEGLAATPAYRGVALAVFENLQLADFGNRIPIMTFEVMADEEPPSVGVILGDASRGAISSNAEDRVVGFAAYGKSIKTAVAPLIDCFGVELFDDGSSLRSPSVISPVDIGADELGSSADGKQTAKIQRDQVAARELPSLLRLTYYEPVRDYQTGEARATSGERLGTDTQQDLPAVLSAGDAKAIANLMIARAWAERDHLTLRLPPSRIGLEPGDRLVLESTPLQWRLDKVTIDGFVVVAELRPSTGGAATIASDAGRVITNPDVISAPLNVALLDVPSGIGVSSNDPTVMLAATASAGWKRSPVEVGLIGQMVTIAPARAKSILGTAQSALPAGATELIDNENNVDVALIDEDQWLTSCNDEALAGGENLAMLGNELIQFGVVAPLGGGRFRLSHLLRGRGGSEWACAGHQIGEQFCVLRTGTLQPVVLPNWSIGATLSAIAPGSPAVSTDFLGESLRPPSPVDLASNRQDNGDLVVSWTRRSRQGFAWLDGIDAPLGESVEQYRVSLTGVSGGIEQLTSQPSLTVLAADIVTLGAGPVMVEVCQIGDVAASRPVQLSLTLS